MQTSKERATRTSGLEDDRVTHGWRFGLGDSQSGEANQYIAAVCCDLVLWLASWNHGIHCVFCVDYA
jgi:hypothetical protein